MTINYRIYQGKELTNYIRLITQMRVAAFCKYPYLYKAKNTVEEEHLKTYAINDKSTLILAEDDNDIIGISTGIPLATDASLLQECKKTLIEMNIDLHQCYYYGEIIVAEAYQNKGIASQLYAKQDKKVKSMGFNNVFILTVIRPEDHPLKPKDYKETDPIWPRFGFKKLPITINYSWPTLQADGSIKTEENAMQLWMKTV